MHSLRLLISFTFHFTRLYAHSTYLHRSPPHVINFVSALYDTSYCCIQLNGEVGEPFSLRAGVRQGCPLSPILYAVVAELLLNNIEHHCPAPTPTTPPSLSKTYGLRGPPVQLCLMSFKPSPASHSTSTSATFYHSSKTRKTT